MQTTYSPEGAKLHTQENAQFLSTLDDMRRAMREGVILEAVAARANGTGSLAVPLGEMIGIMEKSEVQMTAPGESVKDIAVITRVGKPVCFKIIEITEPKVGAPIVRLSRRAAQEECARSFLANLTPGDVIPAKVTHLERFGAFRCHSRQGHASGALRCLRGCGLRHRVAAVHRLHLRLAHFPSV